MLRGLQHCSRFPQSGRHAVPVVRNKFLMPSGQVSVSQEQEGKNSMILDQQVSTMFGRLHIHNELNPYQQPHQKVVILPTTIGNSIYKRTIIDPHLTFKYVLPTLSSTETEKLTPTLQKLVPKVDPDPLQVVLDQGGPSIVKHTMPYLVTVRHKKMKKHKLKKFRKRMLPLHKKLHAAKKRKKEDALKKVEKEIVQRGEKFDAEVFINEQISQARKAGWSLDILKTKNQDKTEKKSSENIAN